MTENENNQTTPREYDYWRLHYRELALLPEWSELSGEERARRLLEKIEEDLKNLDAPPQRKALFACAPEERLKTASRMLDYFEREGAG